MKFKALSDPVPSHFSGPSHNFPQHTLCTLWKEIGKTSQHTFTMTHSGPLLPLVSHPEYPLPSPVHGLLSPSRPTLFQESSCPNLSAPVVPLHGPDPILLYPHLQPRLVSQLRWTPLGSRAQQCLRSSPTASHSMRSCSIEGGWRDHSAWDHSKEP